MNSHHHPMNDESMVNYLRTRNEAMQTTISSLRTELRTIRGLMLKEFRNDPTRSALACVSQTMLYFHAQIRTLQEELDKCQRQC